MFIPLDPRRTRGISLVELLVASTLLLLLVSILFQLLASSWRVTAQGAARAELEQLSLVWGERMQRDLKLAARNSVSISETFDLAVHRRLETASLIAWQPELVLYHPSGEYLERRVVPLPSGAASPYRVSTLTAWQELKALRPLEVRRLPHLSFFEVVPSERSLVTVRIQLLSGGHKLSTERSVFLAQSGG